MKKVKKIDNRYKYKIIEYSYKYIDEEYNVEICKALHKTNSKFIFILLILYFKIAGIKYEVISND